MKRDYLVTITASHCDTRLTSASSADEAITEALSRYNNIAYKSRVLVTTSIKGNVITPNTLLDQAYYERIVPRHPHFKRWRRVPPT